MIEFSSDDPFNPRNIHWRAFTYYESLGRVRDYVAEHYADDLTLDECARVAGLSRKYFSGFFSRKTGVRFRDWLNYVRIERAIRILKRRNLPIARIAVSVGYHDLRTFQRTFKRHTAMTARSYRKNVAP